MLPPFCLSAPSCSLYWSLFCRRENWFLLKHHWESNLVIWERIFICIFLETAWLFSQAKSWWCIWPFFWFTNWDKLKLTITDIVKSWSLCGIHPSFFFQLASCHRLRGGVYLRQVASLFQCCGFAVLKKIKLTLSFLHDPTSSPETPKGFSSALCFISLYVQKHNNLLRCDYNFFFICSLCLSQHTEPALFPRTHLSYLSISL